MDFFVKSERPDPTVKSMNDQSYGSTSGPNSADEKLHMSMEDNHISAGACVEAVLKLVLKLC